MPARREHATHPSPAPSYSYEATSNRLVQIKKQKDTRDFTHDGAGNTISSYDRFWVMA